MIVEDWLTEEIHKMFEVSDDYRTISAVRIENVTSGGIGLFENLMMRCLLITDGEQFGICYVIVGMLKARRNTRYF